MYNIEVADKEFRMSTGPSAANGRRITKNAFLAVTDAGLRLGNKMQRSPAPNAMIDDANAFAPILGNSNKFNVKRNAAREIKIEPRKLEKLLLSRKDLTISIIPTITTRIFSEELALETNRMYKKERTPANKDISSRGRNKESVFLLPVSESLRSNSMAAK